MIYLSLKKKNKEKKTDKKHQNQLFTYEILFK